MATSLKNLSRVPQSVGVLIDGTKSAYVRLMPRSKKFVELTEGTVVDPRWLAHNPNKLLIKTTDAAKTAAAVQAAVVAPAPAGTTATSTATTAVPATITAAAIAQPATTTVSPAAATTATPAATTSTAQGAK